MSIVSAKIDSFPAPFRRKPRPIAVQYDKNDSGEAEPADFTTPKAPIVLHDYSSYGLKKVEQTIPPRTGGVPLYTSQYGSVQFRQPAFDVEKLDIESNVPFPVKAYDDTLYVSYPDVSPAIPYDMGIRAGPRPIKFDEFSEPTPAMFRRDFSKRR